MSSSSLLEHPRRLAAVPGAERPAARRDLRSGVARLLAGGRRTVRRRAVFPALRLRHAHRHRRQPRRQHRRTRIYSFQPTYTRIVGQPLDPRRLRPAAVPGVRREPRAAGRRVPDRGTTPRSRASQDNSAAQNWPGRRDASCSGFRPAARSTSTATRLNNTLVSRRVRAGRLEARRSG